MQEILFYRELDFSLKSIGEILSAPNYDKTEALKEQKHLLTLKKERLEMLKWRNVEFHRSAKPCENAAEPYYRELLSLYK